MVKIDQGPIPDKLRLSRSEFLKLSALAAGGTAVFNEARKASVVTTPALVIGRTVAYVLVNRGVQGDLMPEEKLYDPIEKRPFPTDLATDPKIEKIVQEDFGGQDGVVGYAQFAGELSQQPMKLISEAHLDWAEKVAHREIWTADWVANPKKEMIVGMGRFTPEDNDALKKFVSKDLTVSEDQALKTLVEKSSLTKWIGDEFLEGESFGGVEFGKGLRLLRRLGATIVGTGADRPPITSELNQYYQEYPDIEKAEIEKREQKAAEILFDLERKHPEATIYGMAGRDHIQRGSNEEGITPKLEVMHAQEPGLRERKVTAISFGSIMGDQGFYPDILDKFGSFPQNSVLVVRNPAFGAIKWVEDPSVTEPPVGVRLDWAWPKPDFFVARILYHPLS